MMNRYNRARIEILKSRFTRYEAVFEVDMSNRRIQDESEVI